MDSTDAVYGETICLYGYTAACYEMRGANTGNGRTTMCLRTYCAMRGTNTGYRGTQDDVLQRSAQVSVQARRGPRQTCAPPPPPLPTPPNYPRNFNTQPKPHTRIEMQATICSVQKPSVFSCARTRRVLSAVVFRAMCGADKGHTATQMMQEFVDNG
eukprot:3042721-Rhodomonas_salina.2